MVMRNLIAPRTIKGRMSPESGQGPESDQPNGEFGTGRG